MLQPLVISTERLITLGSGRALSRRKTSVEGGTAYPELTKVTPIFLKIKNYAVETKNIKNYLKN